MGSAALRGVPVKLGAKGIEQIIEIKLTAEEKAGLDKSAAAVKDCAGDRSVRVSSAELPGRRALIFDPRKFENVEVFEIVDR